MRRKELEDALEKQLRALGAAEVTFEQSIRDQPAKIRNAYAQGSPDAILYEKELPELRADLKKLQSQIQIVGGELYTLRRSKIRDKDHEQSDN
jgi:hypothetical protein